MRLPSKVTNYKNSILSKFPKVLQKLEQEDIAPLVLYRSLQKQFSGLNEYIDVLDCLFALGKIAFSEDGEKLTYVERDSL